MDRIVEMPTSAIAFNLARQKFYIKEYETHHNPRAIEYANSIIRALLAEMRSRGAQ